MFLGLQLWLGVGVLKCDVFSEMFKTKSLSNPTIVVVWQLQVAKGFSLETPGCEVLRWLKISKKLIYRPSRWTIRLSNRLLHILHIPPLAVPHIYSKTHLCILNMLWKAGFPMEWRSIDDQPNFNNTWMSIAEGVEYMFLFYVHIHSFQTYILYIYIMIYNCVYI